jgi:hypothetical protein
MQSRSYYSATLHKELNGRTEDTIKIVFSDSSGKQPEDILNKIAAVYLNEYLEEYEEHFPNDENDREVDILAGSFQPISEHDYDVLRRYMPDRTLTWYYFGQMHEDRGGGEYTIGFVFRCEPGQDPFDVMEAIAKDWYEDPDDNEDLEDEVTFNQGDIVVSTGSCKLMPQEHYDIIVMNSYLKDLTPE